MDLVKANQKSIIIAILLLLGLIVGVYLVQRQQVFRSKAGSAVGSGIRVNNEDGKEVEYQGNNTWRTNTTHIEISIDDLNQLNQPR